MIGVAMVRGVIGHGEGGWVYWLFFLRDCGDLAPPEYWMVQLLWKIGDKIRVLKAIAGFIRPRVE